MYPNMVQMKSGLVARNWGDPKTKEEHRGGRVGQETKDKTNYLVKEIDQRGCLIISINDNDWSELVGAPDNAWNLVCRQDKEWVANEVSTTKERSHCHDGYGIPRPGWLDNPQPLFFIVGVEQPEQHNLLHRPQQATDKASGSNVKVVVEDVADGKFMVGKAPIPLHITRCDLLATAALSAT